jgi:hypothetical protein
MSKRPLSITIIGWLFIVVCAAGVIGLVVSVFTVSVNVNDPNPTPLRLDEAALILAVRLLGLVGGVFVLRGRSWARWLLVFWMAYHVIYSMSHSIQQVLVHAAFLVVLVYFLCGPKAAAYFRSPAANVPLEK